MEGSSTLKMRGASHPRVGASCSAPEIHHYDALGREDEVSVTDATDHSLRRTRHVQFSASDLPIMIESQSGTEYFAYDAEGVRVLRESPNSSRTYAGGGDFIHEVVRSSAGARTDRVLNRMQIRAAGRVVAEIDWAQSAAIGPITESTHYIHPDHLGSSSVVTNRAGAVEQRLSFDAFGRRRNPDWDIGDVPTDPIGVLPGFTGHESEESLGLINMRGRMYDPRTRRFLSADPIGGPYVRSQSLNRYSYVSNNPLNGVDPSGFKRIANIETDDIAYVTGNMQWVDTHGNAMGVHSEMCDTEAGCAERLQQLWNRIESVVNQRNAAGSSTGGGFEEPSEPTAGVAPNTGTVGGALARGAGDAVAESAVGMFGIGLPLIGISVVFPGAAPFIGFGALVAGLIHLVSDASHVVDVASNPSSTPQAVAYAAMHAATNLGILAAGELAGGSRGNDPVSLRPGRGGMYIPVEEGGRVIPLPQRRVADVDIPLPLDEAVGPHTVLGGRLGEDGVTYRQSATFGEGSPFPPAADGGAVPWSRVDWHNHNNPVVHTAPHQHVYTWDARVGRWSAGDPLRFGEGLQTTRDWWRVDPL